MTKQALINAIEQLKEQQLIEVLHYVQHLSPTQKSTLPTEPNQVSDPLAEFIGAVNLSSLAVNLDDELYGQLNSLLILGAGLHLLP